MSRINLTVSQARRIISVVPAGSVYWFEAQRVLRESEAPSRPVPGIDWPGLTYQETNDDDGAELL